MSIQAYEQEQVHRWNTKRSKGIQTREEIIFVYLGMKVQYLNHWAKENSP